MNNSERAKGLETISEAAARLLRRLDERRKVSGRQKGPGKILTFSKGEEGPLSERYGEEALQDSGHQLPCPGGVGGRQGSVRRKGFVVFQIVRCCNLKAALRPNRDDALNTDRAKLERFTLPVDAK